MSTNALFDTMLDEDYPDNIKSITVEEWQHKLKTKLSTEKVLDKNYQALYYLLIRGSHEIQS